MSLPSPYYLRYTNRDFSNRESKSTISDSGYCGHLSSSDNMTLAAGSNISSQNSAGTSSLLSPWRTSGIENSSTSTSGITSKTPSSARSLSSTGVTPFGISLTEHAFNLPSCQTNSENIRLGQKISNDSKISFNHTVGKISDLLLSGLEDTRSSFDPESLTTSPGSILHAKVRLLQQYVSDLTEQNEVLVQTMEDVEKENNEKASILEQKLIQANNDVKSFMDRLHEAEQREQSAKNESERQAQYMKELQDNLGSWNSEKASLKQKITDQGYDINCLLHLLGKSTALSRNDLVGVSFRTVNEEDLSSIFDESATAVNSVTSQIRYLEQQVQERDEMIDNLEKKLEKGQLDAEQILREMALLKENHEELRQREERDGRLLIHGDRTGQEVVIFNLRQDLRLAEAYSAKIKEELTEKETEVLKLNRDITDLHRSLAAKEEECLASTQSVQRAQHNEATANSHSQKLESMINDLRSEITDAKALHRQAVYDSQHCERRVKLLEEELTCAREEASKGVEEIGMLQNRLKEATNATHNHKDLLKSELSRRDDTIQKLRREVLSLQEHRDAAMAELDEQERVIHKLKIAASDRAQELDTVGDKTKELTKSLESSKTSLHKSQEKASKYEDKSGRLERELGRLLPDMNKLRAENEQLRKNLSECQSSQARSKYAFNSEAEYQQEAFKKLQIEYSNLLQDTRESKNQITDMEKVVSGMRSDLQEALNREKESNKKIEEIERKNQLLTTQIENCKTEKNNLLRSLNEMEGRSTEHILMQDHQISATQVHFDKLKTELEELRDKYESAKYHLANREESLAALDSSHKEYMEEITRRERSIQNLELQLLSAQEESRRIQDDLLRKQSELRQQETDLEAARKQYKLAVEENGRLEAKMQAMKITQSSDTSVLQEQIAKKDEAVEKLNIEVDEWRTRAKRMEEKINHLEQNIDQLNYEIGMRKSELRNKEDSVHSVERQLEDTKMNLHKTEEELRRCEDTASQLSGELRELKSKCSNAENTVCMRDELISQLKCDIDSLREQYREAMDKLSQRDESIGHCTLEISKLKNKLHDSTSMVEQKNHQITVLEKELESNRSNSAQTKKQNEESTKKKDGQIQKLRDDLFEAQQQYSQCYNEYHNLHLEVIRQEDMINQLRKNNNQLHEQTTNDAERMLNMAEQVHKLELDLSMALERYRNSQNELAQRDQAILRLKSDLDAAEEKGSILEEETRVKGEEGVKLQAKLKSLQTELQDMMDKDESNQRKLANQETEIANLQYERDENQKTIDESNASIDDLTRQLRAAKQQHLEEEDRLSRMLQNTQLELEAMTKKLSNEEQECYKQRVEIENLDKELNSLKKAYTEQNDANLIANEKIKSHESDIESLRHQVLTLEQQLESCRKSNDNLQEDLNAVQSKHLEALNVINEMENKCMGLENKIERFKETVGDRDNLIVDLKSKIQGLEHTVELKNSHIKENEDLLATLNGDLRHSQSDLSSSRIKCAELSSHIEELKEKLTETTHSSRRHEERSKQIHCEYMQYQQLHQHTVSEVQDRDNRIAELTDRSLHLQSECQGKDADLSSKEEQVKVLSVELAAIKEQRNQGNRDLQKLEKAHRSLQKQLHEEEDAHKQSSCAYDAKILSLEKDLSSAQQSIKQYRDDIKMQNEALERAQVEISSTRDECQRKTEEVSAQERQICDLEKQIATLTATNSQQDNRITQLTEDLERTRSDLRSTKMRFNETGQELAHCEEKLELIERTLNSTQDELSCKSNDLNRERSSNQKLSIELKNAREQVATYEQELSDARNAIGRLREEVAVDKQKNQEAAAEIYRQRQLGNKLESELAVRATQNANLGEKIATLETGVKALQEELTRERNKFQQCNNDLHEVRHSCSNLERDYMQCDKTLKETQNQLLKAENTIAHLKEELIDSHNKTSILKESLTDAQGQIKTAHAGLDAADRDKRRHIEEANKYEDSITDLKTKFAGSQEEVRQLTNQVSEDKQSIHELQMEVNTLKGNNKETMAQLNERSSQNSGLRSDVTRLTQNNENLSNEVRATEEKLRLVKNELKQTQENFRATQDELTLYEHRLEETNNKLSAANEKHRQILMELGARDDEINGLRTELSGTDEKLRYKHEECNRLSSEMQVLEGKLENSRDEISAMRMSLDEARSNSDRLHRESELVVTNVNKWVQEQKQANEKLASKIREQSRAIVALTAEKDHLSEQLERYQRNYEAASAELEDKKLEVAKYKELQSHSTQQQVMLEQMKARLEDHETEQAEELNEKSSIIEDLHARLKSNVTTIQQLNQQLNNMNKENLKLKSALDKEMSDKNMLQYQLETKHNAVSELRGQLDSLKLKQLYPESHQTSSAHNKSSRSHKSHDKSTINKELEKAGVGDQSDLDKSYWISRVGELSVQLQQSTDYWKNKVREVQMQAEADRYRAQYDAINK